MTLHKPKHSSNSIFHKNNRKPLTIDNALALLYTVPLKWDFLTYSCSSVFHKPWNTVVTVSTIFTAQPEMSSFILPPVKNISGTSSLKPSRLWISAFYTQTWFFCFLLLLQWVVYIDVYHTVTENIPYILLDYSCLYIKMHIKRS